MLNFNKVSTSKIVSLIIACVFILNNIAYGIDLSEKNLIRKPMDFSSGSGVDSSRYPRVLQIVRNILKGILPLKQVLAKPAEAPGTASSPVEGKQAASSPLNEQLGPFDMAMEEAKNIMRMGNFSRGRILLDSAERIAQSGKEKERVSRLQKRLELAAIKLDEAGDDFVEGAPYEIIRLLQESDDTYNPSRPVILMLDFGYTENEFVALWRVLSEMLQNREEMFRQGEVVIPPSPDRVAEFFSSISRFSRIDEGLRQLANVYAFDIRQEISAMEIGSVDERRESLMRSIRNSNAQIQDLIEKVLNDEEKLVANDVIQLTQLLQTEGYAGVVFGFFLKEALKSAVAKRENTRILKIVDLVIVASGNVAMDTFTWSLAAGLIKDAAQFLSMPSGELLDKRLKAHQYYRGDRQEQWVFGNFDALIGNLRIHLGGGVNDGASASSPVEKMLRRNFIKKFLLAGMAAIFLGPDGLAGEPAPATAQKAQKVYLLYHEHGALAEFRRYYDIVCPISDSERGGELIRALTIIKQGNDLGKQNEMVYQKAVDIVKFHRSQVDAISAESRPLLEQYKKEVATIRRMIREHGITKIGVEAPKERVSPESIAKHLEIREMVMGNLEVVGYSDAGDRADDWMLVFLGPGEFLSMKDNQAFREKGIQVIGLESEELRNADIKAFESMGKSIQEIFEMVKTKELSNISLLKFMVMYRLILDDRMIPSSSEIESMLSDSFGSARAKEKARELLNRAIATLSNGDKRDEYVVGQIAAIGGDILVIRGSAHRPAIQKEIEERNKKPGRGIEMQEVKAGSSPIKINQMNNASPQVPGGIVGLASSQAEKQLLPNVAGILFAKNILSSSI